MRASVNSFVPSSSTFENGMKPPASPPATPVDSTATIPPLGRIAAGKQCPSISTSIGFRPTAFSIAAYRIARSMHVPERFLMTSRGNRTVCTTLASKLLPRSRTVAGGDWYVRLLMSISS
ncbi:MAG: hypothetical protein U1E39_15835 [Planctomycetota bacterium]